MMLPHKDMNLMKKTTLLILHGKKKSTPWSNVLDSRFDGYFQVESAADKPADKSADRSVLSAKSSLISSTDFEVHTFYTPPTSFTVTHPTNLCWISVKEIDIS